MNLLLTIDIRHKLSTNHTLDYFLQRYNIFLIPTNFLQQIKTVFDIEQISMAQKKAGVFDTSAFVFFFKIYYF